MTEIVIFPVGNIDPSITDFLAFSLHEDLRLPCSVSSIVIPLNDLFDVVRNQYYSTRLLERLLDHQKGRQTKLLGVADVDLFIPPLSFVFGEAQFDNPASVISVCRLRQQFYGLPEDTQLLLQRCEKEAVHELGHCFGLIHCRDYRCVMYLSYSVEDIDLKSLSFCPKCFEVLRKNL